MLEPKTFKVSIAKEEQELLKKKLQLARLPVGEAQSKWGENSKVTIEFMQETLKHWLHKYEWETEQHKINELSQFRVGIELEHWGTIDVHFVHERYKDEGGEMALLFLHGWPGNFTEVARLVQPLLAAGFTVVAPSLPGFGFSSYTNKEGFKNWHSAELMHRLMVGLGYEQYVIAGGDWGAMIGSSMARLYPDSIQALHLTNVFVLPPEDKDTLSYSEFERSSLDRMAWFQNSESGYGQIQGTKPRTLGFAMHDSPVGMLAWMADKLLSWSDDYPWTQDEIITWTLLHYFPGPTTAFQIYQENLSVFASGELPPGVSDKFVGIPTGVSAFTREVFMVPRSWAEKDFNVVDWQEHSCGGHFPAYERPQDLSADMIKFFKKHWKH